MCTRIPPPCGILDPKIANFTSTLKASEYLRVVQALWTADLVNKPISVWPNVPPAIKPMGFAILSPHSYLLLDIYKFLTE
jgi:hypothetical protein